VFPHSHRTYGLSTPGREGVNGETRQVETDLALYDLRRDPGERYDVKKENPHIVAELSLLAEEVRADMGDDLMNIAGKNRREPGRIETIKQ
jgi:arylsulfatase